ncbi:MAG TPA: isoprenylcysteine carboxylmethyltransferase family protein [Flavobacteriia bacterium]|nr:isoprenylcysteine carboxylmethyltransferase family protein [Flavobacteriia bacterium]
MSFKSKILVFLQFAIIAFFIIDGSLQRNKIYFIIQLSGLLIALWGIYVMQLGKFNIQPEVKENTNLNKKGPYKMVRNPMYLGIILFFGMAVVGYFTKLRFVLFVILTIVLLMKIFMEEKFLTQKFGEEYLKYQKETFRLLPYVF